MNIRAVVHVLDHDRIEARLGERAGFLGGLVGDLFDGERVPGRPGEGW